ncbi:hypothetical protein BKH24_12200 [Actinomyces oris]|nr:hypothetical protein BKH24_12200 [Actinomyces oris]
MMTVSHDADLRDTQRALAIMILAVGVLGAVAVLSVPFSIGLYGLRGLWIPAVLLIPLSLQGWGLRLLKRLATTLPR